MNKINWLAMVVTALLLAGLGWSAAATTGSRAETTASILYVKPEATGDCSSWAEACDLQDALEIAASGDEVWAMQGVYYPTTDEEDKEATFRLVNGVALYGGFAGIETERAQRDWVAYPTILSGDIDHDDLLDVNNTYRVVTAEGLDGTTILDGFTITAGYASHCPNPSPPIPFPDIPRAADLPESHPNPDPEQFCDGGGVYSVYSNLTLSNLIISGNAAYSTGGGMFNDNSSPTLTNITFSDNSANDGGGMGNKFHSNPTLNNITFVHNHATGYAGGIFSYHSSSPTLTNVTISENTASHGGGMANVYGTYAVLTNVTFSGNSASVDGAIHNYLYSSFRLTNAILWGNSPDQISGGNVTYSIIQGGYPGEGNINADPLLGALADNGGSTLTYALGEGSPAIDAGDPANCPATDQRGVPRPLDGDGDGQAACDIGSFELVTGIAFYSLNQSGSGDFGETLVYTLALYNYTDQADTYSLALGSHTWKTTLSTDLVGPLEPGTSETLTVAVTIPLEAEWYQTDSVVVTATSISDAGEYSTSIQLTTQAYVPPQISVYPASLESNQFIGQSVTLPLTISNGYGVPLDYTISPIDIGVLLLYLDELVGATTFDDSSLYENNGVCIDDACPAAGVPGRFGLAVQFDGVNDTINVANAPSLNPQNAMTISAWILADNWDGNRRIVQKGVDDNQYRLLAENGNFHFVINSIGQVTTSLPSPGNWHHVAGVYDGTRMQLWVDGVLQGEVYVSGLIPTTTDPVYIGTKYPEASMGDYFLGKMDEVQIFDRALSPVEIQLYYTNGYIDSEIPWLTIDPLSASVPTDSSLPIQVTLDATGLPAGIYTTTLFITSNDPLNPVVLVPVTMNVLPSNFTTLTITSDAPDPSFETKPFTVTFVVSSVLGIPSGEVNVSVNDGATSCNATLVNGLGSCELTINTAGNYLLTATYAGSEDFDPCSDTEPHTVAPTDATITTITSDEPDPSGIGEPFTVSFTVDSLLGVPTGSVTVTVSDSPVTCGEGLVNGQGSCVMTLDINGDYILTATYNGAEGFPPSSDSEEHRVSGYSTEINITSDEPDPSSNYDSFTVEFAVTSAWGIPTGEVIVTNGTGDSCQATLVNGLGSCSMFIEEIGDHLLTATYTGSQVFDPSSDSEPHTVNPIDGTITTITSDEPDPSGISEPFTVSFTVDSMLGVPSGSVTVTVSDSPITCAAELVNGQGSCVMALYIYGDYILTATYSGAEGFPPSSDSELHSVGEDKVSYLPLVQK